MPTMPKDNLATGRSHKSPVKRRNRSNGKPADPVCGVPSQTPLRIDLAELIGRPADYSLEIDGKLISKKNSYLLGSSGMFKSKKIKDAESMIAMQIPVWMRGLSLVSPHIEVLCQMDSFRADRDNGYTFLQDCLVNNGILKNDNVASCNGIILLHPVVRGEKNRCVVNLWRNDV